MNVLVTSFAAFDPAAEAVVGGDHHCTDALRVFLRTLETLLEEIGVGSGFADMTADAGYVKHIGFLCSGHVGIRSVGVKVLYKL